ncbi:MAG: sulfate transporter CysZ [Desulfuromonas sp.]|nr:MAG: sulfate transporter CysZ [Desulfuromonas sp.]
MSLKMSSPYRFDHGFFAPFRGARFLLRHPRLWPFILIPGLINTLIFAMTVHYGLRFFNEVVLTQIPHGEAWYWLFLSYLLWFVAVLLTAVLVFFSFTLIGNLIAAPFNDLLSEKTEQIIGQGEGARAFHLAAFTRESLRTLRDEGIKMSLFCLGMLLLLSLNMIPVIGTIIYGVTSTLFTLFFLVVEYTGFVFSRRNIPFAIQRRFIFGRPLASGGFGCGVLLLLAIPLLQLICIPIAVVGATLFCHEQGGEFLTTSVKEKSNAA